MKMDEPTKEPMHLEDECTVCLIFKDVLELTPPDTRVYEIITDAYQRHLENEEKYEGVKEMPTIS